MIHFHVDGPHEIKPLHLPHGRFIDREVADRFWEEYPHIANGVGCYIFSMRAGKGLTPIYVGQSKTGFRHECFQDHKLRHYQRTIQEQCGTPMLFFLVKDRGSHASFEACIDRVENFLIQLALQRNPDLKNIRNRSLGWKE